MVMKINQIPKFEDHERFLKFINVSSSGCWEWTARVTKSGYGTFSIKHKEYRAHRVSYSIFKESPDVNLLVDHICRNRRCVNPEHLRLVDYKTNMRENSLSITGKNGLKTHCKWDHEFNNQNTRKRENNGRRCIVCLKKRRLLANKS